MLGVDFSNCLLVNFREFETKSNPFISIESIQERQKVFYCQVSLVLVNGEGKVWSFRLVS